MSKVELKEGTKIMTSDGESAGEVNRFVLDPTTNEVTHVVVDKGGLFSEDKVVPFDKLRQSNDDALVLSSDINDLDDLPPFEETYYVRADGMELDPAHRAGDYATYRRTPAYYWYPPFGYIGYPAYGLTYPYWPPRATRQNIPANTVALKEGTDVVSADGQQVGDVERLFVEPASNDVSHFLISQGTFFKDRKLVPVSWIGSVTEKEVKLGVSSKLLESLPSYES